LSPAVEVVRTYLELRSPNDLRPAPLPASDVTFIRRRPIALGHYRRLYHEVGARWHWHDRDAWSDEQLATYLASPDVAVWECLAGGKSAGYFELERRDDGSVEIAYFGLGARFIGRGIGKAMLTRAAREAFAFGSGSSRVWLHTCTLDSPAALPNYLARGFAPVRQEKYVVQLPDAPA
jgi:GNAT superfamily N-acetyltransferase